MPSILKIERADGKLAIVNASGKPVRIEKIFSSDKEVNLFKLVWPKERIELQDEFGEDLTLHFEVSLESDIIWPRSKATVVGLADYPPTLLKKVLEDFELAEKVKGLTR